MAIDPIAAACDAIAAHLTTITGLTARRGWPEHGVEASIASGAGLLAVTPGPVQYERCAPRSVDATVSAPNVTVTYRIAWLRIEAQLDLWAPYRAVRDDLVAAVEAKAANSLPNHSDLRLTSTGYYSRPLTVELDQMTPEDGGANTERGVFRQTWRAVISTDLVAQATHPQLLRADLELTNTLGGIDVEETTSITP